MTNWNVPGWTQVDTSVSFIREWRHNEYNIMMHVSHQPDHFAQEGEEHVHDENYDQVQRWHGRVTLGKNVTVNTKCWEICKDSCKDAEQKVMSWALDWMKNEFDSFIENLDDAEEWRIESN